LALCLTISLTAKSDTPNVTQERLTPTAPILAAQKTLSYTKAFCFTHLMKSALALHAIIITSQPILRVKNMSIQHKLVEKTAKNSGSVMFQI
jgi:hypothetical protein